MNDGKRGPGRPKIYANKAEQMRAQRAKRKQSGYREINASIPEEYKQMLDRFCAATRLSISGMICYLLGCAQERDLPDVDRPIDF